MRRKLHQTIRKVGADLDGFQFNTAVAAIMELLNEVTAHYALSDRETLGEGHDQALVSEIVESLVLVLAPFTPHMADELWERLGKTGSTYHASWPRFDPAAAADEEVTIPLQVNGKLRGRVTVPADTAEADLREAALADAGVRMHTAGKTIVKVIVAKGKLVNVVVR